MMKKKNRRGNPDVTKGFVTVANDFIAMADDIDKARDLARLAAVAWNLSLYPQEQIAEKIEVVALEYEKSNPGVIQAELLSQDLQTLVNKKLKIFPYIKRTITKISVEDKNSEEYVITTESIHFVVH